jgi:hypothetical protein
MGGTARNSSFSRLPIQLRHAAWHSHSHCQLRSQREGRFSDSPNFSLWSSSANRLSEACSPSGPISNGESSLLSLDELVQPPRHFRRNYRAQPSQLAVYEQFRVTLLGNCEP